jgi:hypothetical protein
VLVRVQVGLSAMYASLQRLPANVCSVCSHAEGALNAVKCCAFTALHSDTVIKEAAVSAGGVLWGVAILLFQVPAECMAAVVACGLFPARVHGRTLQLPCGTVSGEHHGSAQAGINNGVRHHHASLSCAFQAGTCVV